MEKLLKNLDRWRQKYQLDCSISEHFVEAYNRMLKLTCHCESDMRLINFLDKEIDNLENSIDLDKKMILRIKSEIQNFSKTLDPSSGKGSGGVASSVHEVHSSFLSEIFLMIFIFFIVFLIYKYFKKHELWFHQKYELFYKFLKDSIRQLIELFKNFKDLIDAHDSLLTKYKMILENIRIMRLYNDH